MKELIILAIIIFTCLIGCDDVKVGYLRTYNAKYVPDSLIVKNQLDPENKDDARREQFPAGVRQETRRDEFIHVSRVCGKLHIGHVGRQFIDLIDCAIRPRHGVGTGERRVAQILEQFPVDIRQHADAHGVFHVNARADAARNVYMRQNAHVHVKTGKHNIDGGENRGLRTDERVDIHFRDGNFAARLRFGRSGQNIAAHAVLVVRDTLTGADKLTLGGDDGRAVKFCNDIDDAGAADADGLLALRADDAERRLHCILVNLHGFDRTVCCTHAAGDIAALKRRACRAGAGHHEIAVAEDQLTFVPRSMKSENSSLSQIRLVNAPAVISPPTYEPMFGASKISASGLAGKPRSLAVMPRHWKNGGIYGSMRTGFASTPRSRWFTVVFEALRPRNTPQTGMPPP